jgi:DNA-binding Lrp family transcriptional regulator
MMLKSQDVVVVLKLAGLHLRANLLGEEVFPGAGFFGSRPERARALVGVAHSQIIEMVVETDKTLEWTYATLSKSIGISASECNEAVRRATKSGLLSISRTNSRPQPRVNAMLEFLFHGLKYVFPVEEGALARGIPTGFSAPILSGKLISAGEHIHVWPDANGKSMGITIEPLHKAVPHAARSDPIFYELAALVDAIRYGKRREVDMAEEILRKKFESL